MTHPKSLIDEIASLRARVLALETELRDRGRQDSRYRLLVDNLNVGIFVSRLDGQILEASARAVEMTGYSGEEELKAQPCLNLYADPADRRVFLEQLRNSGAVRHLELRSLRKDGTIYWISLSAILEQSTSGEEPTVLGIVEDISERKLAEQSVNASEQLFNSLVETSADLVWRVDLEGRYTYLNPAWEAVLGYRVDEMLGHGFSEFQDPKSAARDALTFQNLLLCDGKVQGYPSVHLHRDGSLVYLNFNAIVYRDARGQLLGTQGTAQDVTEQKRVAQALAESEAQLRESQRIARLGYYVFDISVGTWTSSETLDDIFGIDGRYLRDISGWTHLIHPEDRARMEVYLREHVLGARLPFDREYRIVRVSDGQESWVHGLGRLELGPDLVPIRLFGTIQDITARKLAEEALESAEEFAQNLIETANVIVVGLDKRGRINIFNHAAEGITGYSKSEALGQWFFENMVPETRYPQIKSEYERLLCGEPPRSFENPILTRTGEERQVVWQNNSVYRKGEVVGTISFGIDVTDRVRSEEERIRLEDRLRQSQKLEALGLLVGGVAHDLNNLLTPIVGYGDMLLEDSSGEDVRGILTDIRDAGGRAQNLVRQLLAFGRKQTLNMRPLDLNVLIRNSSHLLRRTLRDDIRVELVLREPATTVRADAVQLEQVLMNLALNAQDAMPKGGTITVEVAECSMEALPGGGPRGSASASYARLTVKDTGVGIPREILKQIFEPFFTTKEQGRGTGLGLAMVYGIIKQHGGEIVASSSPGTGTRFDVYLPATSARPAEATAPPKPVRAVGGGETILLAEDEPAVRSATCAMLTHLGYRVLCPDSPEDCQGIVESQGAMIKLLVTDVVMPALSGVELYRRLARIAPEIRVLFMSGYGPGAMAERGLLRESVAFIQKPFTLESLASKVRVALDSPPQALSDQAGQSASLPS